MLSCLFAQLVTFDWLPDLTSFTLLCTGYFCIPMKKKEKILMTQITVMMQSLSYSQTSWNANIKWASLQTNLEEVKELQLSYFKS